MKNELVIEGMKCEKCKAKVEKVIGEMEGVLSCTVDLAAKTATVETSKEHDAVDYMTVVEGAGFTLVECK